MFKKILCLGLNVLLLLGNSVNTYAAEQGHMESNAAKTVYLIDCTDGKTIEVPVTRINRTMEQEGAQVKVSSTVEITIPVEQELGIQPRAVVTDGGVTTRIRLDMIYTQSGTRYRLDRVEGAFEQLDKAFTISDRIVKYIAEEDHSGEPKTYSVQSNTSFSFPGHGTWIETNGTVQYWIYGYAKCKISRGGSSWELRCDNTIIEMNPGNLV